MGGHLCEALLHRGDEVVCVDDLSSSERLGVAHLEGRPGFRLVVGDACDPGVLGALGRVDAVAHLASPASPSDYRERPLDTLRAGSRGTEAALELAAGSGARFLLASTSEVYGDPAVHPQPESYAGNVDPVGPRSMYDESKRFAEALTVGYRDAAGVNACIARIFNTYGPRMRAGDGRVVPSFVTAALAGEPLVCFGDGTQTRSLCYVSDLVGGLIALLGSDLAGPVNLGNPEELTMLDLAALVLELTRSHSPVEFAPLPGDDPKRRCPDISLATAALGWLPLVPLREGLARTIDWFAASRSVRAAG